MALLIPYPGFRARMHEWRRHFRSWRKGVEIFYVWPILAAMLAFTGLAESSRAQAISHEYEIKAVFLYNFAKFTEWPTNAFEKADPAFVIGVLGNDPFGGVLETALQNETHEGRKYEVKHFSHLEEIKDCHILFIGRSEARNLDRIVAAMKDRPVLTVSDIDNAAYRGVCVHFLTENNKTRLRINVDSLKKAGLVMSSQLLRVAEIVPAQGK